jgi:hypothetical protein
MGTTPTSRVQTANEESCNAMRSSQRNRTNSRPGLDNFKEQDVANRRHGGTAVEKKEVERAAEGVRRAIGRLVALLGDDDPSTIYGAFETLVSIGAFAAEPLATALPRAAEVRQRAAIMTCLMELAPVARSVVFGAMLRASQRDSDPALRAFAGRNLVALTGAIVMDDIARRKANRPTYPPSGS